jgi:hypothetical protein
VGVDKSLQVRVTTAVGCACGAANEHVRQRGGRWVCGDRRAAAAAPVRHRYQR